MTPTEPIQDFGAWLQALARPSTLLELVVFAGCLAGAWTLVRLWRGAHRPPDSIWFGDRVIDGVLFPVLSLLLALFARWALRETLPLASFRVLVPVLMSLVVIRVTVRVLHSAYPQSQLMRVVERSVSWMAWLAVVLWITGLLPMLSLEMQSISWTVGGGQLTLRNIIEGAVSAVVVLMGALWLSAAVESHLLRGATDNLSVRKMAANALRALLLFVGLVFALSAAGIDLTALGVLGGALGVGIGFGLQKLAANYISGFVILAERSMRIGDMVKVDGFEGRITDINTRYTVIRALTGREAIVPNEMMITQRVENNSLADTLVVVQTKLQVAYGTDLPPLMQRLAAVIAAVPRVLPQPGPAVHLSDFAADGLELTFSFWINDAHNGQGNVRSEVNLALLHSLQEAGVEIPYPQRVLHQARAATGTTS